MRKNYDGLFCPDCGTSQTHKKGIRIVKGGEKIQQHQCTVCGRTFSEKYVANW
jgi:transposase-like protein